MAKRRSVPDDAARSIRASGSSSCQAVRGIRPINSTSRTLAAPSSAAIRLATSPPDRGESISSLAGCKTLVGANEGISPAAGSISRITNPGSGPGCIEGPAQPVATTGTSSRRSDLTPAARVSMTMSTNPAGDAGPAASPSPAAISMVRSAASLLATAPPVTRPICRPATETTTDPGACVLRTASTRPTSARKSVPSVARLGNSPVATTVIPARRADPSGAIAARTSSSEGGDSAKRPGPQTRA